MTDVLVHARARGCDVVEVSAESEERWTRMVDKGAAKTTFGTIGQYVGSNIPGKPKRYLLNTGGRPKLFEIIADTMADDYAAFEMSRSPGSTSGASSPLAGRLATAEDPSLRRRRRARAVLQGSSAAGVPRSVGRRRARPRGPPCEDGDPTPP